ncbi:Flp pilus assembly protein TadD [Sphingobium herbicidovorans NBRC 16415]|uniref:Flp pilus assembly protein TadD n=1 Tax=Sphingobium herbicidovorans (strain ATCC 700291 / DSM 11019 / CCUG 56400 / KCTC 2939 / LMG 18315 / NBRC 16415 / MH) TaxID=1219045 RepID=A0A086P8C9_SPHHM|nr:tetratricopeptide repeat protein [Sphingobium herbicidovorans]KFG89647.1 Flp pilus assembly protein TadD [Sphingobium herbicidovorans NBRC 16415]
MMRRAVAVALILASAACSSANREIAVRPVNGDAAATGAGALARGHLLFSRGEHALALDAYRRAMRHEPGNAHALNGVAISYAAIGRHDLARQYFELALARAPQDERIHRNFARSLTAQGLQAEANALLAQIGQGAAQGPARRPTLAQLAGGGSVASAGLDARAFGPELERVSMGEVRLQTVAASAARPAMAGSKTAQLTTAIVTVADNGRSAPVLSLARELKAPIASVAAARARPVAALGCGQAGTVGVKLPATGYSIDLSPVRADARPSHACATMAGGDGTDDLFEKLWKWGGGQG